MPDSSNQPWIDAIRESFLSLCDADGKLADITQRLEGGKGTYGDAQRYAIRTGELLARAFKKIDPADLPPDQKVSPELADKLVRAPMVEGFKKVSQAATRAQQNINRNAGFEVKPVAPRLNADRIDGIAQKLSSYDTFEEGQWLLDDPMVNFSQSVVDDSIEENAELYGEMGGQPKIIRRATWNCCPWCADLAGTYDYPDVPEDVYSRHENCRCTVEFDPGKGIVQNVHSKQWREKRDSDVLRRRAWASKPDEKRELFDRDTRALAAESGADFYVGPNGKALPAEHKEWIGENEMAQYLDNASSQEAKGYIKSDFRPKSFIGDGSTADVRKFEIATGLNCGRIKDGKAGDHSQKVRDLIRQIDNKLLKDLPESDRIMLTDMRARLTEVQK